jgi:hypothetical protein
MIPKETINSILWRIQQVCEVVKTDTDKTKLELFFQSNPDANLPEFSEKEIAIFRRVVQTGIIVSQKYRGASGFKIVGFLIHLRALQLRRYHQTVTTQRNELIEIMAGTWLRNIEKSNGDFKAAKEKMKVLWGESEMDSNTRSLFNKSYTIAREKWETK